MTERKSLISTALSLIRAAADGNTAVLEKLLSAGAEVNGVNQGGQTALILAALMGRSESVSLLLEAGADVSIRDNHGLTAADWAQRRGFSEITEILAGTRPLTQTAGQPEATQLQTVNPTEAQPSQRETELETQSHPAPQTATEEIERRKAVGFGPAAIGKLKATASPAKHDSELEGPPAEEETRFAAPTSAPEEAPKGHADLLALAAKTQIKAEPREQFEEDEDVLELIPRELAEPPPPLEANEARPGPIRSDPLPTGKQSDRDPALTDVPKAHSVRIGMDEPAKRESEQITPPPKPSGPLPTATQAEHLERASDEAQTSESALRFEANRPAREVTPKAISSPPLPTAVQTERSDAASTKAPETESALRFWVEAADETEPASGETLQSRMETERIFEEARKRVENEVRRKAQYETRSLGGKEPRRELGVHEEANLKRCPKCNTIYEGDIRTTCVYDSEVLESLDGPASAGAPSIGRPTLWALVAITLVGSIGVTYLLTSYLNGENRTATPATRTAAPAKVEENLPILGGALVDKAVNLPNAEYPDSVKREGISDSVVVVVRVNKKGRVISARALNGNQQLRAAAVKAARRAIFSPEKLGNEDGFASGTITYVFKP